ncbi:MAG: monooxygenase [Candidatus Entotheonella factor]|uniref:Monooxygenase n=1 Tax=Entotheonella factor TaxID=1429438 RepID=W4LIB9_ENTF1|nr:MAG: monooxygenase [Candidatus Entotheonella factor]
MTRQMVMVGFLQAQNCTNYPFSWRHPEARVDATSPEYYQEIARVLEAGKFQVAFFDDRLAMPDRYGGDHTHTVENGIRCVKMDPLPVLMMMASATQHLGLGATCSTTYYEPFHIARMFATMDLMTKGRAAWNVVTSVNDGEAMNMGRDSAMAHDLRYDRADEFMEVVLGHWDTWEDGALLVDKESKRFADAAKVHRLDHAGPFFRSRGPFTVPRSQQGHPVIIQAGQSGRGRDFAARWGEVIFSTASNIAVGKASYTDLKAKTTAAGRNPDYMTICIPVLTVVAETRSEAEDKMALLETLTLEVDELSLLAEGLNVDFATKDLDAPMTREEIDGISGFQGLRDQVVRDSGKSNPSLRDFLRHSKRGRPEGAIVGGPKEVTDRLEELFVERVCDGFVVAASHIPGGYADFVRYVIPELQKRGLFHQDYKGLTLRENLGLPRPEIGVWKT